MTSSGLSRVRNNTYKIRKYVKDYVKDISNLCSDFHRQWAYMKNDFVKYFYSNKPHQSNELETLLYIYNDTILDDTQYIDASLNQVVILGLTKYINNNCIVDLIRKP